MNALEMSPFIVMTCAAASSKPVAGTMGRPNASNVRPAGTAANVTTDLFSGAMEKGFCPAGPVRLVSHGDAEPGADANVKLTVVVEGKATQTLRRLAIACF